MKYLSITLFLLISSFIVAQERATRIQTEGQAENIILAQYLDKDYLLSISDDDMLIVYEIVNNEFLELHRNRFFGIKNFLQLEITEAFVLFNDNEGSIAYNFIDNTEKHFPYEGNNNGTYWNPLNKNEVFMSHRLSFSGQSEKYIVNLANDKIDTLDENVSIIGLTDSFSCLREYQTSNASKLLITNRASKDANQINIQNIKSDQIAFDNNSLVYLDGSEVKMLLNSNFQSKTLLTLSEDIQDIKIFKSALYNILFIKNENLEIDIHVYDSSGNHVSTIQSNYLPTFIFPKVVNNHLVYSTDNNSVEVVDIITGISEIIPLRWSSPSSFVNTDDQYLISYQDKAFHTLNLQTLEQISIDWSGHNLAQNEFTFIKRGNELLLSFGTEDITTSRTLVEFKPVSFKESDLLVDFKTGLSKYAQLISDNPNSIMLFDEYAYSIYDSVIIKESELPIWQPVRYKNFIKVYEDKTCWLEQEASLLKANCKSAGQVIDYGKMSDAIASTQFAEYEVCNDKVYFIVENHVGPVPGNLLYEYDRLTATTQLITFIDSESYDQLFSIQNKPYFIIEEKVHTLDDQGNIIDLEIPNYKSLTYQTSIIFQNAIYITGLDGVYIIENNEANLFLQTEESINHRLKIVSNRLMIKAGDSDYKLFDGNVFQDIQLNDDEDLYPLNDEYLLISEGLNAAKVSTIFNSISLERINLDDTYKGRSILKIFEFKNKTYILSRRNNAYNSSLIIDLVDEDFNLLESIHQTDLAGYYSVSDILPTDKKAFVYANNAILSIDSITNVEQYSDVYGHINNVDLLDVSDYIYFIALGPEYGRQVYRFPKVEVIPEPEPEPNSFSNFHPNPTNGILYINEDVSITNLFIFNTSGQLLRSLEGEENLSSIDLSDYSTGIYIIFYCDSDDCDSYKVVKIQG